MKLETIGRATIAYAVAGAVHAASVDQWRSRSIYQVLTDRFALADGSTSTPCNTADRAYCGGTWQGIIKELDYIQNMGFTAIWISPITYNIPENTPCGYAYHGYWQEDLYRLNDHFGTADDLKALSKALHDREMYLMVDIVVNHNGWDGSSNTVDYSRYHPFNDKKYYHDFCSISDYSNQAMVENCWLGDSNVELVDLRTEDQAVVDGYNTWIKQLVSNYSIDGLRLDTAKHVGKTFWSTFSDAAGVFCTGEVYSGDSNYVCAYQDSLDSVLNYPAYYPFIAFLNSTSGNSASLVSALDTLKASCNDVSLLGVFTENHDIPRFASITQDMALAKNALALTLLWDGIPIVYAGQEQHYAGSADPANREATWLAKYSQQSELYQLVASINQVRNQAIYIDEGYLTYNVWAIYKDTQTVALRKGYDGNQIISVYTNRGASSSSYTLSLSNTGWTAGTTVYEILTCNQLTVGSGGSLTVPMSGGLPRIYFSTSAASGSGICGAKKARSVATEATSEARKSRRVAGIKTERRKKKRTGAAAARAM